METTRRHAEGYKIYKFGGSESKRKASFLANGNALFGPLGSQEPKKRVPS